MDLSITPSICPIMFRGELCMKAVGKRNDVRGISPECEKTTSFPRSARRDAYCFEDSNGMKG
jgi:hypothetical protein